MDLSQKLSYYRDKSKVRPEISSSLKALQEHFSAEILFDEAPVILITREMEDTVGLPADVTLNMLSKGEHVGPVDLEKCVFFDLETTGLAGGAGTFAFLIGFAYVQEGKIFTRQFFLPDYGREYHLFDNLQEWLKSFEYIVSFNGKSYDMPLLSSRFIINRIQPEFRQLKHIDIVHLCRRIWKDSLPSCDLSSIETHLLKIERESDIPGEFIPQAYFNFIQSGVIHDVIRMVEHNYRDIASLVSILARLNALEHQPQQLPLDNAALARLVKLAYDTENHDYWQTLEAQFDVHSGKAESYHYWKSMSLKKTGSYEQAVEIWRELSRHPDYCMEAIEEAAKYYEHIARDLSKALQCVDGALKRLDLEKELGVPVFSGDWQKRFEYRRNRIVVKQHKC